MVLCSVRLIPVLNFRSLLSSVAKNFVRGGTQQLQVVNLVNLQLRMLSKKLDFRRHFFSLAKLLLL